MQSAEKTAPFLRTRRPFCHSGPKEGRAVFTRKPKPIPYTEEQAMAIIYYLDPRDPEVARLLNLMWRAGLRVTEATYLRAQDIDLENRMINLNEEDNANRTKGGRPRVVEYQLENIDFFAGLKNSLDNQPTGHLFANRRGLPDRARQKVRQACTALTFPAWNPRLSQGILGGQLPPGQNSRRG